MYVSMDVYTHMYVLMYGYIHIGIERMGKGRLQQMKGCSKFQVDSNKMECNWLNQTWVTL